MIFSYAIAIILLLLMLVVPAVFVTLVVMAYIAAFKFLKNHFFK